MTDRDLEFEHHLALRLRADADHGMRPYDALEVARAAMWADAARGRQTHRRERRGLPVWFRSLVLAGLLVVLMVAAAFAGGWIRLPTVTVLPTPTATAGAIESPPLPLPTPPTPPATLRPTEQPTGAPTELPTAMPGTTPSPRPSPSPSAETSPTPEPSPTAQPTPVSGWRQIQGFPTGGRVSLTDVAHGQAGFVMIARGGSGGRSWVSPDGVAWTRSSDTAFPGGAHAVAMDGQFYAIASTGVWQSANGLDWSELTSSPGLGFVYDVTVDSGVMIAVGTDDDFERAMIWTSADGVSWTSLGAPDGPSELTKVAARGGDIVVIADGGSEGHGRRLYFRPTHSSEWQRIDAFGEDLDGRLLDIATNGRRFVAVGYEDDWNTGVRRGIALSSVDGTSWSPVRIGEELVFDQIVALADGRFLVVATSRGYSVGDCQPAACIFLDETAVAYTSPDGIDWREGSHIYQRSERVPPEIGDMVEHPRDIAAGPQGVVLLDDEWADGPRVFFGSGDRLR
ncbi:MAG TPA: hypothetical protein VM305_11220 [Candidatus Limnocylindrales bacterium]|nr:hypothetical protein [Candidatus Limnocylindrales bacterium]